MNHPYVPSQDRDGVHADRAHATLTPVQHSLSFLLQPASLSDKMRCRLQLALAALSGCQRRCEEAQRQASRAGFNRLEMEANRKGRSLDAAAEHALSFALKLHHTRGHISSDDCVPLRAAGFSDQQIVDVIALVAVSGFAQ